VRLLILGGDGYLGWPTAMHFAARGHDVCVMDNYLRRRLSRETASEPLVALPDLTERVRLFAALSGNQIEAVTGDCGDYETLVGVVRSFAPDTIVHYAEQPSAPYSMMSCDAARRTLDNNIGATFNVIWAVIEAAPRCHIVKLGTMGEYGTPDIDIEEGWITIEHKGRSGRFLFPRQAGSLYHTTKILDTDLLWFYVRTSGLQVTDLMQGPVYGLRTPEMDLDERLSTFFSYDDIFGTVVNRFVTQAVARMPLTVYGRGGQTRGYLNLLDTLQCVELAASTPPGAGKLRVLNQFTECFSVNALAERVTRAGNSLGLEVRVESLENPRLEAEEHYYNPLHSGLLELGLQPHFLTEELLVDMMRMVMKHQTAIDERKIRPRVQWKH
jgi:UDP-sulfoquinovose synthase